VSDLAREQAKFEREIEQVRARRERDEGRLGSGAITVAKQLQDLEREVATLRRRQSELEDSELEVMERAETAQAELDRLTEQRSGHAEAARRPRHGGTRPWSSSTPSCSAPPRAAQVAGSLPEDLLALYTRLRASEGGVGAGEISRGRCGGCRLDLMNNEKSEIRAAAPDEVLLHEECGRIMVRTAESGL
jgi:predicted  nucleic acid-binding Zn-ribbon protein